jgi:hypothetical protein
MAGQAWAAMDSCAKTSAPTSRRQSPFLNARVNDMNPNLGWWEANGAKFSRARAADRCRRGGICAGANVSSG